MIFSVKGHVEQILAKTKTQTRRKSPTYLVDRDYAIQPRRTAPGLRKGRILITEKWEERYRNGSHPFYISRQDAKAEGGYTPEEFENLFQLMHPQWITRFCYKFKYLTRKELREHRRNKDE